MNVEQQTALLEKLTKAIEDGARPDFQDLAAAIRNDIREVDTLAWASFEEVACNAYHLTEDKFYQLLLPPMFSRKGSYTDDFLPLLRKLGVRGWLMRYIEHTMTFESPTAFHFAPALAVLGTALRRQVWIDQGIYKIWPAVQVFLMGPSGYTHKSTAANYAIALGEASGRVIRLMDEGSHEALKKQLSLLCDKHAETVGLLYASEFSSLLSKADYHKSMVPALIDLFDCRDRLDRLTNSQGPLKLRNIAISAVFCSNEELALSSIPASAFGGGLMSRILVFFQSGSDRRFARPLKNIDLDALARSKQQLLEMLAKTGIIMGEFHLTAEAEEWYEDRYNKLRDTRPEDERMAPLWSRYGDHLLRLSMLLKVSEMLEDAYMDGPPLVKAERLIDVPHFQQADGILRWILQYVPKVYAFLGLTPFGAQATKVLRFLQAKGGRATQREIGRKMKISKRALAECLETVVHYGYVSCRKNKFGGVDYTLERDPFEGG